MEDLRRQQTMESKHRDGLLNSLAALEEKEASLLRSALRKPKYNSLEKTLHEMDELEFKRSTSSLSLQEEKQLLRELERLRSDRRVLEEQGRLNQRKKVLKDEIKASNGILQSVGRALGKMVMAEKISARKGGGMVTVESLVKKVVSIAEERIGHFVGKQGANLNSFEEKYCVSLDLDSNGRLTIEGIEEDVDAAAQAVDAFNREIARETRISDSELKMLKRNKGGHMRSIESVMSVSLTIVPSSKRNDGDDEPLAAATLVIRGAPENVEAACTAVRELAAHSAELAFQPRGTAIRQLLANGGAILRSFEDENGVGVDIDKVDGVITLTGSKEHVEMARVRMAKFIEDNDDKTVQIELENPEVVSSIIGKGGNTVQRLQQETGANISVRRGDPSNPNSRSRVEIRAPPGKLNDARIAVETVIEQYARENVTLEFPDELFGALYGVGGATVTRLQEQTGASITLQRTKPISPAGPKSSTEEDESGEKTDDSSNAQQNTSFRVYIRGKEDNVAHAVKAMKDLINDQTSETIPVREDATSTLIGARGSVVSQMEKDTGAIISVRNGVAIVRGTSDAVAKGVKMVREMLEKFERENSEMWIDPSVLGTLIGKGGATLNKIREETGATIEIASEGKERESLETEKDRYGVKVNVPVVRIRGETPKLEDAIERITELIGKDAVIAEDQRDSLRDIEIPIPSAESTRKLVGHQGGTIKALEAKHKVKVAVMRKTETVRVRGMAGPDILQAADTVRDLLEQGVHCTTEVSVKTKIAALFSDRSAPALRRLQDETGANVELVSSENGAASAKGFEGYQPYSAQKEQKASNGDHLGSAKVKISGPASSVRMAREIIDDMARGIDRDILKVTTDQMQVLVTKGRSNLDRLVMQQGDGASDITLEPNRNLVRLKGKANALPKLKTSVVQLLKFFFPDQFATIALPSAGIIPSLIGKKGANIRKMQQDYSVSVSVDKVSLQVNITGESKEEIEKAATELTQIVETWKSENAEIPVSPEAIPAIIGKKGATIKSIRTDSGAQGIDVDRTTNVLRVRGSKESIEVVKKRVQEILDQYEKQHTVISIEPEDIPSIIGVKGGTIKSIEQATGVQIRIGNERDGTIQLNGEEDQIVKAKEQIEAIAAKASRERQQRQEEQRARKEEQLRQRQQERQRQFDEDKLEESARKSSQKLDEKEQQKEGQIGSENARLTVGTPIEMDTHARHDIHFTNQKKSYPIDDDDDDNKISPRDILGMLLNNLSSSQSEGDVEAEEHEATSTSSPLYVTQTLHPPTQPSFSLPPGFDEPPPGFTQTSDPSTSSSLTKQMESDRMSETYYTGAGYTLRLD